MRIFVKTRDMKPGEASVERSFDMPSTALAAISYVTDMARQIAKDYQEVWMVTVELNIGLACILPRPENKEGHRHT